MSARVIVQAPSHLGLRAAGVEALPEALLTAGLAERLGARRGTRLAPPAFDPTIDPGTGLLNPHGLGDHASRLADAVGTVLDQGAFPIVLGGDCTILLGITLALRRRGRSGLLFLDGHADFYQPQADPTGEAASMELALVTGRGPDLVTDLEGRPAAPRRGRGGVRVPRRRPRRRRGSQPLAPTISAIDLASVRDRGAERAAHDALATWNGPAAPPGSGSIWMSTSWMTPSCPRSTTTSQRAELGGADRRAPNGGRQRAGHRPRHHDLQPHPGSRRPGRPLPRRRPGRWSHPVSPPGTVGAGGSAPHRLTPGRSGTETLVSIASGRT